jgi:hypothetical protein
MNMSFWEEYEQTSQEESGGGGIVGQVQVDVGYKVYAAGYPQEDTFFAVENQGQRDQAKAAAQAFATEAGAPNAPKWGLQLRVYADGAHSRGQPVTWAKGDRFFNSDSWTDACKEVVVPSLKENNIAPPWVGWARLGFAPDPWEVKAGTMKDVDQQGNPRYSQRAYVVEVFANKAEAMAAVGSSGSDKPSPADVAFGPEQSEYPEGWDADSWQMVVEAAQEGTPMEAREAVGVEYGVDLSVAEILKMRKG